VKILWVGWTYSQICFCNQRTSSKQGLGKRVQGIFASKITLLSGIPPWFPDPWLSVWYFLCWMCACDCEYGGADRTPPLWWVFNSSLLPTLPDMAPSQQCHAVRYACDGRESLWFGTESSVKKLSMPSVLYAFFPPICVESLLSNSLHYALISSLVNALLFLLVLSLTHISRHLHMTLSKTSMDFHSIPFPFPFHCCWG